MGARGSKCFAKSDGEQAAAATPVSFLSEEPQMPATTEVKCSTAAPSAADVVDESAAGSKDADERTQPWYQETLLRCAELKRQQQKLLQARKEVKSIIARFAPAFDAPACEDTDEIPKIHPEGCKDEAEDEENVDDDGSEPRPSYEELLAEEEALEEEVEVLRETLCEAATMIATVVEKSQELSEHLDEVENQVQLPTRPITPPTDTSSDETAPAKVSDKLHIRKFEEDFKGDFKLPTLKFLTVPGAPDSQASSSTATPRSGKSSARDWPETVSCEA